MASIPLPLVATDVDTETARSTHQGHLRTLSSGSNPPNKKLRLDQKIEPRSVTYGTNEYSLLSLNEQDALLRQCLLLQHPQHVLERQGFFREDSDPSIQFMRLDSPTGDVRKRRAIVLDCEMATVKDQRRERYYSELVFLCAIDFLTGEKLIELLVRPQRHVTQWNTRCHGIHYGMLKTALEEGRAVNGWRLARERLFELIDSNTILIGHALHNDLKVLGITPSLVVDSQIVAGSRVFGDGERIPRASSLKVLAAELCDIAIQVKGMKGRTHDCMEDTFATREVLLYMLRHPEKLEQWARQKKEIWDQEVAARQAAKKAAEEAEEAKEAAAIAAAAAGRST